MKDDRVYLEHILECTDWVFRHTAEGKDAFFTDRKTQSAVLRELQTLAESAQHLSESLTARHPEVPWERIAGFRNVLVHNYLGIKLQRVWEIVQRDLPDLRVAVEAMRRETEDGRT
jgi:uncharacterized protein with HEPN domain